MLDIRLSFRPGAIDAVSIARAQPRVAALLRGRTPAAALELLGRLYAVCGRGQRAAAELALAAAAGTPLTATRRRPLAQAVALEAVQEHLWRLLVDWPRQLGIDERRDEFVRWYRAADPARGDLRVERLQSVLEREWLGLPLTTFAKLDLAGAREWASARTPLFGRILGPLLAVPAAAAGLAPREAGAIARQLRVPAITALAACAPLAARVAARILDLGLLLEALGDPDTCADRSGFSASSPARGRGRGGVEVARGRLHHAVELEHGQIIEYTIAVPTDANFATDGAYGWHLRRQRPDRAAGALEAGERWALALDPCVPYRVSVAELAHA